MTAFALDDMSVAVATQYMCHTEPAARSDDTDYALLGQGHVRPAKVAHMFRTDANDRMTDRTEIIDQGNAVDAESRADHRWTDDPRIVGKLQHFACDRAGDRYSRSARERPPQLLTKCCPGDRQDSHARQS